MCSRCAHSRMWIVAPGRASPPNLGPILANLRQVGKVRWNLCRVDIVRVGCQDFKPQPVPILLESILWGNRQPIQNNEETETGNQLFKTMRKQAQATNSKQCTYYTIFTWVCTITWHVTQSWQLHPGFQNYLAKQWWWWLQPSVLIWIHSQALCVVCT